MEFDAVAQCENPAGMIVVVDLPGGGEAGGQPGDLVGSGEVPVDQPVERRKSEKAKALATVVGDAGCVGMSDAVIAMRKV
jgi:hypothetical protein